MDSNAKNEPITWFKNHFDNQVLDLSPDFQRKPVWSDSQASYLIDSILSGLPVPEIFIRTITDKDGNVMMEVVDGQQRLRSIIRFFSGELRLQGPDISDQYSNVSWRDMTPDQRKLFWSYKIVVRDLEGSSNNEVRDMFKRLNANQSNLTPQELRHAQYSGQFITLAEYLADKEWWGEHRIVSPAQIRRMGDVEFVAELLAGMLQGPMNKKNELDNVFLEYDQDWTEEDSTRIEFEKTIQFVNRYFEVRRWRSKTDFYSLFLGANSLMNNTSCNKDSILAKSNEFKDAIDMAKKKTYRGKASEDVRVYVEASTRASTDYAQRVDRIELIERICELEVSI